jgi:sensor c-di-GMP phosphodiesterase-like protein
MRSTTTRRSRLLHWTLLGVFLGSLVPVAVLLAVSYYQTLHRSQAQLEREIDLAAQRADSLLRAADTILTRIAADSDGQVTPETFKLLRRYVYNDPRFREVGIINQQGFLVLSSLEPIEPPIAISPNQRADLNRKSMQMLGPLKTAVMKEESIILSLPTQGQGEVNLVVDPIVFTYFLDDTDLGPEGFIAFMGQSGRLITGVGRVPDDLSVHQPGIRMSRSVKQNMLTIVGEIPSAWILRDWWHNLMIGSPTALCCSLLLVWLFMRTTRQIYGIEHDIQMGLENDEFEIYYQPIVDAQTQQCVGSEALIRWQHPELGLIFPEVFIPIAEKTQLIQPLSEWMMHQVIQDYADLLEQFDDLYVSLNLSPDLLISEAFLSQVIQLLTEAPFPARHLLFEVTESRMIDALHAKNMARLRYLGANLALDDFGTGYSSLSYLDQFKFDYLKIDRYFVQRIQPNETSNPICDTLIELSRKLELRLVAEGVETEAQYRYLQQAGVQYIQGWLFAKAMPFENFKQFLQQQRRLLSSSDR